MNRRTKQMMEDVAEQLMDETPPQFGQALYEDNDPRLLRLRMAYQRWMLLKLAERFPQVPLLEVVEEVVAPLCH